MMGIRTKGISNGGNTGDAANLKWTVRAIGTVFPRWMTAVRVWESSEWIANTYLRVFRFCLVSHLLPQNNEYIIVQVMYCTVLYTCICCGFDTHKKLFVLQTNKKAVCFCGKDATDRYWMRSVAPFGNGNSYRFPFYSPHNAKNSNTYNTGDLWPHSVMIFRGCTLQMLTVISRRHGHFHRIIAIRMIGLYLFHNNAVILWDFLTRLTAIRKF